MLDTEKFINELLSIAGITGFCGVPCSNLKYLINYSESLNKYYECPNEGDAIAYSVGKYLGSKEQVAIMMQNSGLMNALNAITSLSYINRIPQLYIIGYRGMHGKGTDEPQHELTGDITAKWLLDCDIEVLFANSEEYSASIPSIARDYMNEGKSVAILVDKNDFSEFKHKNISDYSISSEYNRDDFLRTISELRDDNTVVVTTTGFTSRAMYDKFSNDKNFYMVGSMGDALAIGVGIAESRSDLKVIVVDGDGAIMMRPEVIIMSATRRLNNLFHVIINNGIYESTGKQYCPGTIYNNYNLEEMLNGLYNEKGDTSNNLNYFSDIIKSFILGIRPIPFIVVPINSEKNDNKLGRPKESTKELRERFMRSVGSL